MIKIILNGQIRSVDENISIFELLKNMKLNDRPVAVEVNECVISRSNHLKYHLKTNDQVEIVQAIGGG